MIDRAGLAEFLRAPPRGAAARGRRAAARAAPPHRRAAPRGGGRAVPHVDRLLRAHRAASAGRSRRSRCSPSIAQGLHLCLDERDHLFRLAGHHAAGRGPRERPHQPRDAAHPRPAEDTPAEIVTELGETLRQTPLGVALSGDTTRYTGPARSLGLPLVHRPGDPALYAQRGPRVPAPGCSPPGCARSLTRRGPGVPGGAPRRPARSRESAEFRGAVGASTRSASARARSSASCTPSSARSSCPARPCSTPSRRTRCWSTRRCRAARATRSSSCSR